MTNTMSRTRILVECALMIAIGTVLAQIKIFEMPFGGSITLLSMLPFILVGLRHGVKWGLLTGFVNSLFQMLLGFYFPPANNVAAIIGVVLLDYVLAFSVLGLAGLFAKPFSDKTIGALVGSAGVCLLRLLCSIASGALLWGSYQSYYEWAQGLNVWVYSILYNSSYMLPELVLTSVCLAVLVRTMPKLLVDHS